MIYTYIEGDGKKQLGSVKLGELHHMVSKLILKLQTLQGSSQMYTENSGHECPETDLHRHIADF